MQTFTSNLNTNLSTSDKKQAGNHHRHIQQANSFIPSRKHSLIKLTSTISKRSDCAKNNFTRSFTAPNFNFSTLRSLSPLLLQSINYNHSNNHLKGAAPALSYKLINYNNAQDCTTLNKIKNFQQLKEKDKTSFSEFKPTIKPIRKLSCLTACKLNLGSIESHSLPTHYYNNKLKENREDCTKRSELDRDKLIVQPQEEKLAFSSFDQNSTAAARRINSDNIKAPEHTYFISIFKNNDNLKSNRLNYNNTTKSNKNTNNNNKKKSPDNNEKNFERNKKFVGCTAITNKNEEENSSKTIKPHLKGKRNTPIHRAITTTTTTTTTQNQTILINNKACFSSSYSSLFRLHNNKQTSFVRNSKVLRINPSLRNHDRFIEEALNSSMKRSEMNMNLAGTDPAESDELANQDTISSSQLTTTKTTKKSTKFIPISNSNLNEASANSIPISNQISIQRNATSHNPNETNISNSIRTGSIIKNNNENSNTITTEKSSNFEQKYEKQQRFVLEERDTNSNDLARINSLAIRTNTDNFKYIDDDDDYQCHDSFVDRIVPKSRVSNVDLRHELKESINHIDKLIDSASSTKIVYPKHRSSSAYQETEKRPEAPVEIFHPTWDEWKRSQNKFVDNNQNNSNNETNSFKKENKKQKTSTNSSNEKTTSTTHRSVIEESYRQSTNNNNKQEYQIKESDYTENSHHNKNKPEENFETKQTYFKQTSSNPPVSLQLNNADTVNMRNQVKLNHNVVDDCVYHPPTPILINDGGSQSAFPSFSNQNRGNQIKKQSSVEFESSSNGFNTSSRKKERKQNLTKRLEQILYSQLNENPIPITPITQAQTNIKQVLSKNFDSSSRNGFVSTTSVRSSSHDARSPTKSPTKNHINTPRHPVYPIDRKPHRAASPVQFSTVVLAKEVPKEIPIVTSKVEPPQVHAPQPKKITKTILSTKKRKDSAPSLTGWRSDTDESDSIIQSQLVTKKTGAIPIEYISIRRDPKPVQKKETVKKSITTGTNTNTERGKKIASTNTNKDELPQYNLHVSLDSLFVKSRREASTETEIKNHNVGTETTTKHRDACTVTDDEGEAPAPRIHEQYCYAHNSRFDQWETRSNPPEPQETIRLELLAKSPRTLHRKNYCVNSCYNSTEDLHNSVCQPIYTQPKQFCAVDDDDLLIFGNSSQHQFIEDSHHSVTRRTGSIPNLCYVPAPVVQAAPVRRYIKTTHCYGTPMASQTMLHTSNTNLTQDHTQVNQIQSKFDEIFGIQRNNECYSTHSLGHFEAVPKVERYYKTTRTTNSQLPSFGEVYQQRHNEYLASSSHQRSGSNHHAQSQQQRGPIIEIPATPDSTIGRMSRQQHFSSSSASHMGQHQAGSSGYSSFNRKAMNSNESHVPMYTTLPNETIHIKATTVPASQNGDLGGRYQNENMSSSHRSVRTNGGRYEEEEHFSSSNGPDDSENRQFRPIFQPVFTEQSSKTQKWPNSNKQHNIV